MADFIPLTDAAKTLGVSTDDLVEMLSRQEIFGYRDGSSWKFKQSEIERVQMERSGDILDEDDGEGSSLLLSPSELDEQSNMSDVALVPDPDSGSGVSLVNRKDGSGLNVGDLKSSEDDDLSLAPDNDPNSAADDEFKTSDPADAYDALAAGAGMATTADKNQDAATDDSEHSINMSDSDGSISLDDGTDPDPQPDDDLQLSGDSSEEIQLADGDNDLSLKSPNDTNSDIDLGSDLQLLAGDSGASPSDADDNLDVKSSKNSSVLGDSDLAGSLGSDATPVLGGGDSGRSGSSGGLDLDDDLVLAADDEDDLVLGSGSDLALAADSGINLMSPSDSGLVLDDEPLDLGASGISGLDLAGDSDGPASNSGSASASGSLVDFQGGEEFQLTPSGGVDADDDSGSQIIELEDSADFGDDADIALPMDEVGAAVDADGFDDGDGLGDGMATAGAPSGAAVAAQPETPYRWFEVIVLLCTLMVFGLSAILVTDIVRNMWGWSLENQSDLTTGFTDMVLSGAGMKK